MSLALMCIDDLQKGDDHCYIKYGYIDKETIYNDL